MLAGSKAVDKVVTQVSEPAVSQCFQPADAANSNARSDFERAADWKSAIQQVGNLRYDFAARRFGALTDFVNGLGHVEQHRRDELTSRRRTLTFAP